MQPWKLQPARDHGMSLGASLSSLQRENGLVATGLHLAWWGFVRGFLAVWHRLTIHGRENVPKEPPFVLIANHSSHLDTLALAAAIPWRLHDRVFPIAAGDVFFQSSGRSAFAALFLNALPLWRKKAGGHALGLLRQRLLEDPCCYILFPEGTRSRDGVMHPFKTGVGMLVAETNVPVVPCYLKGCYEALQPGQRFPRPRKVELFVGAARTFGDVANDKAGWVRVAAELEAAVRETSSDG